MMVRAFHAAGTVILDVVYNHTAEGNQPGPILLMRGMDNLTTIVSRPIPAITWTLLAAVIH
jgi:hypothetical protein